MATATKSFGTLLKREDSPGAGTFTTVGGIVDVNFPEIQADTAETTDMEATDGFRTHVTTLFALGDVTGELMYDSSDATQEQMTADAAAGTIRLYKIIATDTGAADWAFNAYVTRFSPSFTRDGVSSASITLKPTGAVTRT